MVQTTSTPWQAPPERISLDRNEERRIGIELEFIGPNAMRAAELVQRLFGGELTSHERHRVHVKGSDLGDFTIELDMKAAHPDEQDEETEDWQQALMRTVSGWIGDLGSVVVPMEIVCPPVPLSQAPQLDGMLAELRRLGAQGSTGSLFYAFGAQLNPEVPDTGAGSILAHLQAFLLLRDWLREEIAIDPSRRIVPFADPFPVRYQEKILRSSYRPDLTQLIDDYVDDNPTRNRELDMLPLLRHLDDAHVRRRLPDEKIHARPTFHYRLPNMDLEKPDWSIGTEWNRWLAVERLAADPDRLAAAMAEWQNSQKLSLRQWLPASRAIAAMINIRPERLLDA
ncbi:MAG: amidoligase family protein [Neomegalonema sp.]|nr:amidoligase family protein [Neomegalonema sp.]